jgi:hypothetical protein
MNSFFKDIANRRDGLNISKQYSSVDCAHRPIGTTTTTLVSSQLEVNSSSVELNEEIKFVKSLPPTREVVALLSRLEQRAINIIKDEREHDGEVIEEK